MLLSVWYDLMHDDPAGSTWKSILVISSNPSLREGSLYLDVNPVNAILGRIVRLSGFICLQVSKGVTLSLDGGKKCPNQ